MHPCHQKCVGNVSNLVTTSNTTRLQARQVADVLRRVTRAFLAWCAADEIKSPLLAVASPLARAVANAVWHDAPQDQQLLQLVRSTLP